MGVLVEGYNFKFKYFRNKEDAYMPGIVQTASLHSLAHELNPGLEGPPSLEVGSLVDAITWILFVLSAEHQMH
ncbi:unnamed protein product [Caretta caretta]